MNTATVRSRADGRTRRNKLVSAATASGLDVRVWIDRGIEAAWLVAAIVTPLIVLSETSFLSKTELPKVATIRFSAGFVLLLLLVEAGLLAWRRGITIPCRPYGRIRSAMRGNRDTARMWVMVSVIAVIVTTGISTAFALLPRLSTWGADPGSTSNSLYSSITYAILFFAVATRLRNPSQMRRLLGAMIITGTVAALVGIAQHFGSIPFGIRSTSGSSRVTGTAGNPIFFAAILAMTLILAMGMSLSIREVTRKTIGWLSLYGVVATIHFIALLITLSRGPWISVIAGMIAIFALAPLLFGLRRVAITALATGGALVVSLVFLGVTPESSISTGTDRTSVGDVRGRTTSFTGLFDLDSNPRIIRWNGALDLALNRPEPPAGAQPGYLVRSLFGYGPDTFPDVFTMVAPEILSNIRSTAAHNDPLNRLVETGVIGLLAWIALWASLAVALLRNLWKNRHHAGSEQILTLAIGAALATWFVVGLTGIPKSGDTVFIWLLAGLVVATPKVFSALKTVPPVEDARSSLIPLPGRAMATVAIGLIAAATIWITWTETVSRISADASAASSVRSIAGDPGFMARLNDIDRAISLAADQPRYHTVRSEIFDELALDPGSPSPLIAIKEATISAERALALNPLDRDLNFRAAYLNWELAKTGDVDAAYRTYALYERLAILTPQHSDVSSRLSAVGDALGFAP
jgi:O-antigen ligase